MKIVEKLAIILFLAVMIFGQHSFVYARYEVEDGKGESEYKTKIQDSSEIYPGDYKPTIENEGKKFNRSVGIVLGIVRSIGIIVSIGAVGVIGIRMMIGSVEEKSVLKQALPGYIIGAILVMTMTTLPSIIYNLVTTP